MTLRFEVGKEAAMIVRAHAIRQEVFVVEQAIDPSIEWDALDDGAFHFIAVDEKTGRDIGTARAQIYDDIIKLQRIAILKEMRGRNVGFDLVNFMLSWGRKQANISNAKLDAQSYAVPFYEKIGFVAYGEQYEEAEIPHRHMQRPL
ncbi:MAG: GNAT family N-acetyltransferase [Hyphomicrobiales bacterium]